MSSIIDRFLIWWLHRARYPWSRLYRATFEKKYRGTQLPHPGSLQDIEQRLREVDWVRDTPSMLFDAISYPETVWAKKKDDCDGFAVLAAALLHQLLPSSNPVLVTALVRPVGRSHTVCTFRHGARLWFFDNDLLRKVEGNYNGYDNVVAGITQGVDRIVCWDVIDPESLKTIEFRLG
jgi:hypothetical protein